VITSSVIEVFSVGSKTNKILFTDEADQVCVEMPDLSEHAQANLTSVDPIVNTEQTCQKSE
jgi:hypothetical protein